MPKQFLEAGKIVGTHGVRGDLKVQSWCDSPEVLCDFDTLYLDEKTPVTVEKAQVHKNVVLMHLEGVDTVEAAEALRGRVLHLDREDVELPEDLVFIQDILGFRPPAGPRDRPPARRHHHQPGARYVRGQDHGRPPGLYPCGQALFAGDRYGSGRHLY